MAAAANGEKHPVITGEVHGGDRVRRVRSAGDQGGPLVDHTVMDLADLIVAPVVRLDQLAPQPGP